MEQIDLSGTYRLVGVTDRAGNDKSGANEMYAQRIGCITQDLQFHDYYGRTVVRMHFIQDAKGNWVYRKLRTSSVEEVVRIGDGRLVVIRTHNSMYFFAPAELKEDEPLDEKMLIELFLADTFSLFAKGWFYDAAGVRHELACNVNGGMFSDSCMIFTVENNNLQTCVCRYFPEGWNGREGLLFYESLYAQPRERNTAIRFLLHNVTEAPMWAQFQGMRQKWTIQPGEAKYIDLADLSNADPEVVEGDVDENEA